MGYFDDEKNVKKYIQMAEGYDGRALVDILRDYLKKGASVLELGMGPGKDLEILSENYQVTGSDNSEAFIERYRKHNPDADLLVLDAVTMDTPRRFDSIYSNKVLHHLTKEELRISFHRQAGVLTSPGIALHSFWYGDKEEFFEGLRFVYYTEDRLTEAIGREYQVVELEKYTEMDENDSLYVVLKKIAPDQP